MVPQPVPERPQTIKKDPNALPETVEMLLTTFLEGVEGFDARTAADRIILEAERVAHEKKCEMRTRLKLSSPELTKKNSATLRGVYRSRIEAKVSRMKGGELTRLLKGIIRWLIENREENKAEGCGCDLTA